MMAGVGVWLIAKRLAASTALVLVLGDTPGLEWEIRWLLEQGLVSKLLIVIPARSRRELRVRWGAFCHRINLSSNASSPTPEHVVKSAVIRFEQEGRVHTFGRVTILPPGAWLSSRLHCGAYDTGSRSASPIPSSSGESTPKAILDSRHRRRSRHREQPRLPALHRLAGGSSVTARNPACRRAHGRTMSALRHAPSRVRPCWPHLWA